MSIGFSIGERGIHVSGLDIERVCRASDDTGRSIHIIRRGGGYLRVTELNDGPTYIIITADQGRVAFASDNLNIMSHDSFVMMMLSPGMN